MLVSEEDATFSIEIFMLLQQKNRIRVTIMEDIFKTFSHWVLVFLLIPLDIQVYKTLTNIKLVPQNPGVTKSAFKNECVHKFE